MATYFFVSALQPTVSGRVAATAPEPIDLCVTSPSSDARSTARAASNSHWVFTVAEPLLAGRKRGETVADVMARYAQALRLIAGYSTRSALVVCDDVDIIGTSVVVDEDGLMRRADDIERKGATSVKASHPRFYSRSRMSEAA